MVCSRILRQARVDYVRGKDADDHDPDFDFDYDGEWRYAGRGYDSPEATELARSLHQAAREVPHRVPHSFLVSSHMP